jgi:excisionase family DNA binding protein
MPELLTTDEAAAYLRLSERKLYELVANGAVPCTKATGARFIPTTIAPTKAGRNPKNPARPSLGLR